MHVRLDKMREFVKVYTKRVNARSKKNTRKFTFSLRCVAFDELITFFRYEDDEGLRRRKLFADAARGGVEDFDKIYKLRIKCAANCGLLKEGRLFDSGSFSI